MRYSPNSWATKGLTLRCSPTAGHLRDSVRTVFDCRRVNDAAMISQRRNPARLYRLMNFWIADAIAFVGWWALYFFVSDKMTDAGIGWINAINPHSDTQYSLASKLTVAKHVVFAVLMIVTLVFLARHYPSYRNWSYELGLLWNVCNGLVVGVTGLVVIVALWSAGV